MPFYFMILTLRTISVGITYAIWSGAGIVLATIAGVFLYKQIPNIPTIIGYVPNYIRRYYYSYFFQNQLIKVFLQYLIVEPYFQLFLINNV